MLKRIWTIFVIRNREFIRDRSAFGWNVAFPFLIILGFSLMFSQESQSLYKVGVVPPASVSAQSETLPAQYERFRAMRYLEFITFSGLEPALDRLAHHRIDLVVDPASRRYWINMTSPKGYIAEKLLEAAAGGTGPSFAREVITGRQVPYVEWLFPGVLGMNMMFSALFGVGYVVVRYRKNGVLKRMSVTPLRPFEFLTAQILSRMFILIATTALVYAGCALLFGFECRGSYLTLLLVFTLGGFSMVALGLLVASRSSSEEFAGGVLNVISWPMMFLSEVWFSLEGAHPWVRKFSAVFPLTHMIDASRKVMNDGAGIAGIHAQVMALSAMSAFFLILGSVLFSWQKKS